MENNELNNLENKQLHGEVLATKVEQENYQKAALPPQMERVCHKGPLQEGSHPVIPDQ